MAFIPALLSGSTQLTMTTAHGSAMALSLNDFFLNLFMNPGENSTAIMIMGGVTVAACVGLAFLIMRLYEKCCPERNT
ncbi:MAG: hypothetical protein JJU12_01350 [Chlamydiales bacterium]|nr:hypothetical protein [Chlamydiales bacterium]